MTKEDYVETIYIKGTKVDVGLDDYGQCYYFEFENENGELESLSCGTYNSNYLEEIYSVFDHKGVEISLYGKDIYDENTVNMFKRYVRKRDTDPESYDAWLEQVIIPRVTDDYDIYDFDKMYQERAINGQ